MLGADRSAEGRKSNESDFYLWVILRSEYTRLCGHSYNRKNISVIASVDQQLISVVKHRLTLRHRCLMYVCLCHRRDVVASAVTDRGVVVIGLSNYMYVLGIMRS